jgi:acetyl esterase/lipase
VPIARRAVSALALVVLVTTVATGPPAGAQEEPERYLDRIFPEVEVDADVVYGAAPDEDGRRQVLNADVYTPIGDDVATRPAIVLAHGGGFVGGDKSHMRGLATAYAQRGFVALSIEYRMHEAAGGISYPPDAEETARIIGAKHDMQAAVRWIRANAGTYGVDPQRVSVGGSSAGAVMAVVVATLWDDPGSSGTPGISSRVCTAISMMGAGDPALIDATDAGAIFFHGDQDSVVPYAAAVATHDAMVADGLPAEMVTFPGAGHGLPDGALVEQRSSEWMVEHMVERETGCAGPAVPANASFVRAAHQDLLGRPATDAEVVQQAGLLDAGGTRAALLTRLTTSDEWLGSIVTRFYTGTLDREPDAAGLAYWVDVLRRGRLTVAQVAASFYAAPEYYGRFGPPSNGTTAQWVMDLYDQILDRAPNYDDVDYWVSEAVRHGRSWVAVRLYGSPESRRDRVTALYELLLGRGPEPDGLAYWSDRIAVTGDLALARSLAGSGEYGSRAVTRFP